MTEYRRTDRDLKKLERDIKAGKTFYSVETADTPLAGLRYAQPWEFKYSRLWGWVAGPHTAKHVLFAHGPLYDAKPANTLDLFDDTDYPFEPDPNGKAVKEYKKAMSELRRKAKRLAGAR